MCAPLARLWNAGEGRGIRLVLGPRGFPRKERRRTLAGRRSEWYHALCNLPWEVQRMPRETSKASGRDLIGQAQDQWGEWRDKIPQQQRQDLGQILTELGTRINYACTGQQPESHSKYATLGGSELASHAQKTVQRVTQLLPVDATRSFTLVVIEMANRVRYAAEGETQSQGGGNGEGFDFEREMKHSSQSQHSFA